MAALFSEIYIKSDKRPAIVTLWVRPKSPSLAEVVAKGIDIPKPEPEEHRALVHEYPPTGRDSHFCEFEDGTMHEVPMENIRYIDSKGLFDEFCWEE